jgi:hypothetical protein
MERKDSRGQQLAIGDIIVYSPYKCLRIGKITHITKARNLMVQEIYGNILSKESSLVKCNSILKVEIPNLCLKTI